MGIFIKIFWLYFNSSQPTVAFHIETTYLTCTANQLTGFYMNCNTRMKWMNAIFVQIVWWKILYVINFFEYDSQNIVFCRKNYYKLAVVLQFCGINYCIFICRYKKKFTINGTDYQFSSYQSTLLSILLNEWSQGNQLDSKLWSVYCTTKQLHVSAFQKKRFKKCN